MSMQVLGPQPGPQTQFLSSTADIVVYGGAAGGGKGMLSYCFTWLINKYGNLRYDELYSKLNEVPENILDKDGKILSWDGRFKPISLLQHGDRIMNPDGQPQEVLQIHPRGVLSAYRVTFEDATFVECDSDHLWSFWEARANSRRKSSNGANTALLGNDPRAWNTNYITRARVQDTEWLYAEVKKGRRMIIPVSNRLNFTGLNRSDPSRAYLYGLLIGDGCIATPGAQGNISLASVDSEIQDYAMELPGVNPVLKAGSGSCSSIFFRGKKSWIYTWARNANLYGKYSYEKSFPEAYLRASTEFRISLAQGLFDSDGYASTGKNGNEVSYTTTSLVLSKQVADLVRTLGYMAKISSKEPICTNAKGGPKKCRTAYTVRVEGNGREDLFRLERKKQRALGLGPFNGGVSWPGKRIESIEKIDDSFSICITVSNPNHLYITDGYNVTHNSYALLLEPLRHKNNADFAAVVFRRTSPQLTNPGALWDEAAKMYPQTEGKIKKSDMEYHWGEEVDGLRTGMKVAFRHMEHEKNKLDWQGAQVPLLLFDEITHFTESMITYMLSRNRSASGVPGYMRGTCNPDPDSWVRRWIDWWIKGDDYPKVERGLPIPERIGIVRFFIRVNDDMIWASTRQELVDTYQEPNCSEEDEILPKSFTFIPATIYDNRILLKGDPSYLASLKSMPRVERESLLGGNWDVRASAGAYYNRDWIKKVTRCHPNSVYVRFWDRAASVPSEVYPNPDWTVGLLMARQPKHCTPRYVICDVKRDRQMPAGVRKMIYDTADEDGKRKRIVVEQEPGSSGKADAMSITTELIERGFEARKRRPTGNKLDRYKPFSAICEVGDMGMLPGTWNDDFHKENENCTFDDKDINNKDDQPDGASGAFTELTEHMIIPDVKIDTSFGKQINQFNNIGN